MASMDIFNNDAFSLTELTLAINSQPVLPTRIGNLGLFAESGMSTLSYFIERRNNSYSLVPAEPRGAPGRPVSLGPRDMLQVQAVHLPQRGGVNADEVQGVRAFGSMTEVMGVQALVNEKLAKMKTQLDLTLEYQRIGAIKGVIYDADGTTVLYDMPSIFNITQDVVDMNLDNDSTKVRLKVIQAKRLIEAALGGRAYTGILALCSPGFFDGFISHPSVEASFKDYQGNAYFREDQRPGFPWAGVNWEEYSGGIGGIDFIEADVAYLIPLGVPDMFITKFAPADYMETVNTVGVPYYARQQARDFGKGVEMESQSNPLTINTLPKAVVKLTRT
jgi:hypothetical protein